MTISTIDLTQRLDQLENRLPPLPAKSFAFGRATVRRTNDVVVSVVSDVARRMDTVVKTARTGARTTTGQARSAVDRTAQMAETTAKQTAGQAKSAVKRTSKVAETTTKQTIGQAKRQAAATAAATQDATGELLDDATATVDPDAAPRGIAYEEWTKSDLYDRAQVLDIDGRSGMSKRELIAALRSA
jgi:methyl-accepting chemotaxis protein